MTLAGQLTSGVTDTVTSGSLLLAVPIALLAGLLIVARPGGTVAARADEPAPWSGTLVLDRPRHRDFLRVPLDYPRINGFPEWFTAESGRRHRVTDAATGAVADTTGAALSRGRAIRLDAPGTLRLRIEPAG